MTERELYEDRGYLVVDGVLDDAVLGELRTVADDLLDQSRHVDRTGPVFELDDGHSPETPRLLRIRNPVEVHPAFDRVMRSAAILDVVATLLGDDLRYEASKLNMKASDGGRPVEWHQDFAFYPHSNDDLCAVGVALDDCTEDNGCLLVAPGSHRGPVLDHSVDGRFVGAVNPSIAHDWAVEPVVVPAGGISVHHSRLLHASSPNRSSRPRRLLLLQYAAADAFPLRYYPMPNGDESLAAYNELIVRGTASRSARFTAMTAPVPNYTTGSVFELQEAVRA